jgi:inner membrane protein
MDSLTQIVLGAAISEHFIGRKVGNRALLYGAILGTIPDLDVFIGKFYDVLTANEIHRGYSHSLLFFLTATPCLGMLLRWLERKRNLTWPEAAQTVFWCLCTHALLDAFTNWGTQLFWPLETKVAIQSIFVIDPLYTLPFIFCLIRVMMFARSDERRTKWNNRGLIISSCYLLITVLLQFAARQQFSARLEETGIAYNEISVRPAPLNTILWNANVQTPDGYLLGEYSFLDSQPISFQFFRKNDDFMSGRLNDKVIQRLIKLSEGWYTFSKEGDDLYFNDLRFGLLNDDPDRPEFVFCYLLKDINGNFVALEAENPSRGDPGKLLRRLWIRLKGN